MAFLRSPLTALCLGLCLTAGAPTGALAQAEPTTLSVEAGGKELTARVIRRAATDNASLIVGLHGYGMNEGQIETLVNVEPASSNSFVALRGPVPVEGGGHAWFPVDDSQVYALSQPADFTTNADIVADAIAALTAELSADPRQVYVVGFSQGASMALGLALTHPDLAAGYIAFAGSLPPEVRTEDWTIKNGAPVLIGYGTRDSRFSAEELDATIAALSEADLSVELQTFAVPHVVSGAGRRAIAAWIDDRIAGRPVAQTRPLPLAVTAAPDTGEDPQAIIAEALAAAEARGGYFGNPDGDLVIYKFFDFNCSICRIAHRQMGRFLAQMPDNTRVVAVDVPLIGPGSREATAHTFSIVSPDDYNRAYHALMVGRGQLNGVRALRELEKLGILPSLTDSQEAIDAYQIEMRINTAAMRALGIQGTPGFYVRLADGREGAFTGWDAAAIAAFIGATLE
ncbi:dienelactone hydrolase family protein [uncultured Roseibium sp.]|uniref:dienelactone hydrolase family protein n=1 Tax=uncultured Roseibium sp. TaxID=1936171 RepID=UPI00261FBF03|nr:dienelactone hydrolase family protein [uncultured Roseibium sp.]